MLRPHFGLSVRPSRPRHRPFRALPQVTSLATAALDARRRRLRRRLAAALAAALATALAAALATAALAPSSASCSCHREVSKEAWDTTSKEQKVTYIDSLLASAPIAKQMNELIKQSYGHMKKKIVTPVVFEHLPETKNKKYFEECLDLLTAEDYAKVVAKVSPPRASPSLPPRHCFPLRRPQLNSPQPNCLELNGPHTIRATPLRRHCTLLAAPLMTSDDL